ncbi:MAG: anti-sigma regulatory factor [Cyanobacteria bacterium J06649_4]
MNRSKLNMLEETHLRVHSRLEELVAVQQWFRALISQLAEKNPWVNDYFDQLNLALAEGFTNAVRHAHAHLPGSTPIDIELVLYAQQLEIRIFDQGEPFDPDSLSEPKPGALREGGYGWFLLRRLADQVTYSRIANKPVNSDPEQSSFYPIQQKNCLRIVKTANISEELA